MSSMEFILEQQRKCRDYLLEYGEDRGAALGLADWVAAELLLQKEIDESAILPAIK